MRILLANQFFWPDLAPTGRLLTDVSRDLAALGHEVVVICGKSVYAMAGNQKEEPPVETIRVGTANFSRSPVRRMLSYASFFVGALVQSLRIGSIDAVVTLTTPPLLPLLGFFLKKVRGCQFYIWEMDVFPDSLASVNILSQKSLLYRCLKWLSNIPRRQADRIIVLGDCMRARLVAQDIPADRIEVAENWSEPQDGPLKEASSTANLTILYSGNLGLSHDIETIAQIAELLRADDRFRFLFAGGGARRADFEKLCESRSLSNVEFLDYADADEFAERLRSADIGLVTQNDSSLGIVVPSKIYGLMAAACPTLFIGPRESTAARVIAAHECGWHIDCGAARPGAELLLSLAANRDAIRTAGLQAHQAFFKHYTVFAGTKRISTILRLSRHQAPACSAKATSNAIKA